MVDPEKRSNLKNWRESLWIFAPFFLWIAVIFFLSSDYGSMSHTSILVRPILAFLFPKAPEETLQLYHAYVRKAAHFTEYAILAFLAVRTFSRLGLKSRWKFVFGLLIVVAVATIDEFNQSFEASRTGSVIDVGIDIFGGFTALFGIWLLRPRRMND